MKRITFLLVVVLFACVALGGGLDSVAVKLSNVSTTSAATADTTSKITGWLERIDTAYRTSSATLDLDIKASNAYSGVVRTLLTVYTVGGTNSVYTPRDSSMDTAGTPVVTNAYRFCLLDEYVLVAATNASATNQNVLVTIIYERP
jgi:hypothetical protein